jgi:hypothetical protein
MSLDNYTIPAHIKVNPTEKNYFNKYPFRVEFTVDKSLLISRTKSNRNWGIGNNWSNLREIKDQLASTLSKALAAVEDTLGSDIDCRLRSEGYSINIYFAEVQMLGMFLHIPELAQSINQITCPLNQQHLDSLCINKVVRFRHSLFLKKYTYKVYLQPSPKLVAEYEKLKLWLDETYHNDNDRVELNSEFMRQLKGGYSSRYWGSRLVIYFAEEIDLMMGQLRLNEHIKLIEQAVLFSNLEVPEKL